MSYANLNIIMKNQIFTNSSNMFFMSFTVQVQFYHFQGHEKQNICLFIRP